MENNIYIRIGLDNFKYLLKTSLSDADVSVFETV